MALVIYGICTYTLSFLLHRGARTLKTDPTRFRDLMFRISLNQETRKVKVDN